MKILLILVITSVVMAADVAAQSGDQPVVAVSAVDKISPLSQPLAGTLFFNPLERDRMERARKTGSILIDDMSARNDPPVMNGFVKRDDGITSVWIDGTYKSLPDARLAARIDSTSVGMNIKVVASNDFIGLAAPPAIARAKASEKTRKVKLKPKSRATKLRK